MNHSLFRQELSQFDTNLYFIDFTSAEAFEDDSWQTSSGDNYSSPSSPEESQETSPREDNPVVSDENWDTPPEEEEFSDKPSPRKLSSGSEDWEKEIEENSVKIGPYST
jgi:hypothetical protein